MSVERLYEDAFSEGARLGAVFYQRFGRLPRPEEIAFASRRMAPGATQADGGKAALERLHREWVDRPLSATSSIAPR